MEQSIVFPQFKPRAGSEAVKLNIHLSNFGIDDFHDACGIVAVQRIFVFGSIFSRGGCAAVEQVVVLLPDYLLVFLMPRCINYIAAEKQQILDNSIVDFTEFINSNNKEVLSKYKISAHFKNFKIEQGNIVWGKNWDLIFPVLDLYKGRIG